MCYSILLVESGLTFLNTLLKNKLIQDLYIFKNNMKLGKNGKNNDTFKYLKKTTPKLITINLNNDKLFKKEF
jgi:riboflavin biosynthesis pyrimidine reductase